MLLNADCFILCAAKDACELKVTLACDPSICLAPSFMFADAKTLPIPPDVVVPVVVVGSGVGGGIGMEGPIPATVATAFVGTEISFKAERERRVSSSREAEHLRRAKRR